MVDELTHLETIIIRVEDSLFLAKNPYEIEEIQSKLRALRLEHQKKLQKKNERSQVRLFFFIFKED